MIVSTLQTKAYLGFNSDNVLKSIDGSKRLTVKELPSIIGDELTIASNDQAHAAFHTEPPSEIQEKIKPPVVAFNNRTIKVSVQSNENNLLPIIEVHGEVSDEFLQKLNKALQSMPKEILVLLKENGYKVIAAEHVVDVLPNLKGVSPPGWGNKTWDNSDGVFARPIKSVVVAEKYLKPGTSEEVYSSRVEGVARHELGHAALQLFKKLGVFDSEKFNLAYIRDLNKNHRLSHQEKRAIAYLNLENPNGKNETFAEMFATKCGGGILPSQLTLRCFQATENEVVTCINKAKELTNK